MPEHNEDYEEIRKCSACGEEWVDDGDDWCKFCPSVDTYIVSDREAAE